MSCYITRYPWSITSGVSWLGAFAPLPNCRFTWMKSFRTKALPSLFPVNHHLLIKYKHLQHQHNTHTHTLELFYRIIMRYTVISVIYRIYHTIPFNFSICSVLFPSKGAMFEGHLPIFAQMLSASASKSSSSPQKIWQWYCIAKTNNKQNNS